MNSDISLLTHVHKNAQMGVRTTEHILDMLPDQPLCRQLRAQRDGYQSLERKALEKLNQMGEDGDTLTMMDKAKTSLMIEMSAMTDRSPAHIAEMMITGSNMGILDGEKQLRQHPQGREDITDLLKELMRFEEDNVQKLKAFLG